MRVKTRLAKPEMNKLEADWALSLEAARRAGDLQWWAFEPISIRLGKGASYCPDFIALTDSGELYAYEAKGFWREAARVRIKVAARACPWMRFVAVQRNGKGWKTEEIGA